MDDARPCMIRFKCIGEVDAFVAEEIRDKVINSLTTKEL